MRIPIVPVTLLLLLAITIGQRCSVQAHGVENDMQRRGLNSPDRPASPYNARIAAAARPASPGSGQRRPALRQGPRPASPSDSPATSRIPQRKTMGRSVSFNVVKEGKGTSASPSSSTKQMGRSHSFGNPGQGGETSSVQPSRLGSNVASGSAWGRSEISSVHSSPSHASTTGGQSRASGRSFASGTSQGSGRSQGSNLSSKRLQRSEKFIATRLPQQDEALQREYRKYEILSAGAKIGNEMAKAEIKGAHYHNRMLQKGRSLDSCTGRMMACVPGRLERKASLQLQRHRTAEKKMGRVFESIDKLGGDGLLSDPDDVKKEIDADHRDARGRHAHQLISKANRTPKKGIKFEPWHPPAGPSYWVDSESTDSFG